MKKTECRWDRMLWEARSLAEAGDQIRGKCKKKIQKYLLTILQSTPNFQLCKLLDKKQAMKKSKTLATR